LYIQTTLGITIAVVLFIATLVQLKYLFDFLTITNQKLIRFLDAIKYSDFVLKFPAERYQIDSSFNTLNTSFNEILDAFRKERSEKEEHLQYLNTVVRHVTTGLLAYNSEGEVSLLNNSAKNLIGLRQIKNVKELANLNEEFYTTIVGLPSGKSSLLRMDKGVQLAIHATSIKIKDKLIKILAFQNIYPELQGKEVESWQNLTKILRHEIMNSITPIASLNSTIKQILEEELVQKDDYYIIDNEVLEDVKEGVSTIENRTKGLINFIDAYRNYRNIPTPKFVRIVLSEFLTTIFQFMKAELKKNKMQFQINIDPEDISINADFEQLEMVIINIIKNAIEARKTNNPGLILVKGYTDGKGEITLEIKDNGTGIIPEAIDQIFIPFYTTKTTGSGIGLSLSKQIMQLHNGTLTVVSEVDQYTNFIMKFH